jgi:hypothetical protein
MLHGRPDPAPHKDGPGGWWIATEISVAYEAYECPIHDLAGWRKDRSTERPRGVIELTPDWVSEIVSPGHERKDTLTLSCFCNPTASLSNG